MVNIGNPLVIEIWNLVFIEFNRKANGILELTCLPNMSIRVWVSKDFVWYCRAISPIMTQMFFSLSFRNSILAGKLWNR